MSGVVIEATNSLDGETYCASIVPKQQVIEYWLAPTVSPGGKEPQSALVTLKATATSRKSVFAMSNPPLLFVCYGIGRLEFDGFCALVLQILSTCDLSTSTSVANSPAINEICARHGVIADQGEFRASRLSRPVPFLMLFDHDSTARGY
jgi:hypothetical protein